MRVRVLVPGEGSHIVRTPIAQCNLQNGPKAYKCPSPKREKRKFGSLRKGWGWHQEVDLMTHCRLVLTLTPNPPIPHCPHPLTSDSLSRAEVLPVQPRSTSDR